MQNKKQFLSDELVIHIAIAMSCVLVTCLPLMVIVANKKHILSFYAQCTLCKALEQCSKKKQIWGVKYVLKSASLTYDSDQAVILVNLLTRRCGCYKMFLKTAQRCLLTFSRGPSIYYRLQFLKTLLNVLFLID